jgi:hypothetical protein
MSYADWMSDCDGGYSERERYSEDVDPRYEPYVSEQENLLALGLRAVQDEQEYYQEPAPCPGLVSKAEWAVNLMDEPVEVIADVEEGAGRVFLTWDGFLLWELVEVGKEN